MSFSDFLQVKRAVYAVAGKGLGRRERDIQVRQFLGRRRQHPQGRDLGEWIAIAVDRERRLERRERELVAAQCAIERVRAAARDEVVLAHEDAALRATEQLVAREAGDVRAVLHAALDPGLVLEPGQGPALAFSSATDGTLAKPSIRKLLVWTLSQATVSSLVAAS